MSHPARGAFRLARLGAFVAACLVLGVAGHAYGGAGWPPAATLALLSVPLTLLGLWFTRVERGVPALLATLGGVQVCLHVGLHLLAVAPPSRGTSLGSHGHAAAFAPGALRALDASGGSSAAPSVVAAMLPGTGMLAAHVLAVAAAALLLGWGEHSLWAWCRRMLPRLPDAPSPPSLRPATLALPLVKVAPSAGPQGRAPIRGPPRTVLA